MKIYVRIALFFLLPFTAAVNADDAIKIPSSAELDQEVATYWNQPSTTSTPSISLPAVPSSVTNNSAPSMQQSSPVPNYNYAPITPAATPSTPATDAPQNNGTTDCSSGICLGASDGTSPASNTPNAIFFGH